MEWKAAAVSLGLLGLVLVAMSCSPLNRPGNSEHAERARLAPDELLLKHRTVLLRGQIDDKVAEEVIAKLLFLQQKDPSASVSLYIDSPGGAVTAGLAIRDTINDLKVAVFTHCLGTASGVAAFLLAHGARGRRSATKHARLAILPLCSPDGGLVSEALARLQALVIRSIAADSRQEVATVARDVASSRQFDAESARSYGIIDSLEE